MNGNRSSLNACSNPLRNGCKAGVDKIDFFGQVAKIQGFQKIRDVKKRIETTMLFYKYHIFTSESISFKFGISLGLLVSLKCNTVDITVGGERRRTYDRNSKVQFSVLSLQSFFFPSICCFNF